jgi:hypothetical protein
LESDNLADIFKYSQDGIVKIGNPTTAKAIIKNNWKYASIYSPHIKRHLP